VGQSILNGVPVKLMAREGGNGAEAEARRAAEAGAGG
jgi:hypothetical protein